MTKKISENFIIRSDAYKFTHWKQYPAGIRSVYSYLESRGGESPRTCFFGLQYYLKEYLNGSVLDVADVEQARVFCRSLFGRDDFFNYEGWMRIATVHGGRLPVRIRAVNEGAWVQTSNVLMVMENTDPELPWLTNFLETLLAKVWYTTSVATYSGSVASLLNQYAIQSGGVCGPFSLNDFGYRGVSSEETGLLGGMAHLVHFSGTDTCLGIAGAMDYYSAIPGVGMSVFATEHSTTTSHGEANELSAMEGFIDAVGPDGIVSIVIDSYNAYRVVDQYMGIDLRDKIMSRNGRVVLRPDSGDPVEQVMYILNSLGRNFGYETNLMGYKVLPPQIGIIYGDFISYQMIDKICVAMLAAGWAVDSRNVVFGMGGNLLQNTNRDTHKFAIKCSAIENADGEWIDVWKNPVTMKSKASKRGRLGLIYDENAQHFTTVSENGGDEDLMPVVFENGTILVEHTFQEIRNRAAMFI